MQAANIKPILTCLTHSNSTKAGIIQTQLIDVISYLESLLPRKDRFSR